ncbi:uncharacterized protein BDCG_04833 [Blastomyces dermatitidis ER-3]|uniref:Uncharacterized protein n=1 Tax=Ajellomyces dermatitidis (strain ER-3 / ATCC MYA-2586) TaxID=559297 RepID=A0ABP2EZH0_AJEDR|nr:uncharacterized protein BDCG_04833 [Blastomyces dermatitidis ER-3]EEQ89713.2 hypothetical protein BDCG_04833 [Blastomyces dermatitidis ER-3]EQL28964.1 hypothetical protein BDFG_08322 [Blastomyces dermatitidis ATCC 26199]
MAMNPQVQFGFISVLPREIRDSIYLELWHSCGLPPHILWHSNFTDANNSHLCRWQCTTEYQVEDQLQQDIEALRNQLGVPLDHHKINVEYSRRLKSPYLNPSACGEIAAELHGDQAMLQNYVCIRESMTPSSSEVFSSECLLSIYGSTTFVLADMRSLQAFSGYCEKPPLLKKFWEVISPPALLRCTKHLEVSLTPNFSLAQACARSGSPQPSGTLHDVGSVTISAPLSKDILPKDGYVEEDITQSNVHLWKRGAGDKLHPRLWPMRPGDPGEGQIYSGTVCFPWKRICLWVIRPQGYGNTQGDNFRAPTVGQYHIFTVSHKI